MVEQIKDKLGRPIRDLRLSVTDRCNLGVIIACLKRYLEMISYFYLKMNF